LTKVTLYGNVAGLIKGGPAWIKNSLKK